jgi:hypothetical protein
MNFSGLLPNQMSFFGVSYLKGEELEVVLLRKKGHHYHVLGVESISTSTENPASSEAISHFRNHITNCQNKGCAWIHLVWRNVSFVKMFSMAGVAPEERDVAISKRIYSEIPYLSDEVVLRQTLQETKEAGNIQVIVTGVSKAVLREQMKKLEAYGISTDQVMLSTDILDWFYRTHIVPSEHPDEISLLIYLFGDQVELLFFEGTNLVQSRWIAKSADPAIGVREAVQSSISSFQREWRRKPTMAVLVGMKQTEAESFISDPALSVKQVFPEIQNQEDFVPILVLGAAEAHQTSELFDYTLNQLKTDREKKVYQKKWTQLSFSVFLFALSLFLMILVQTLITITQISWIEVRSKMLSSSVGEVKKIRHQAMEILSFEWKKDLPLVILASLRKAVSDKLFLQELDYSQKESIFSVKGLASGQSDVDKFVSLLEKDPIFEHLSLEGVQSGKNDQGVLSYEFTIKGNLKEGLKK